MKSILILFLFCLLYFTESYKILVVIPIPVKSLNILGRGVARHLLNDGHEVTLVTTHPMEKPPTKNFRQIDISNEGVAVESDDTHSISYILENGITRIDGSQFQELARETARITFQNENFTKLIENTNEHFDAVIVDYMETEVYAGLSVLYNCPMMWLCSMGAIWQSVNLIADPANPAYNADRMGSNIPPFSFVQRIEELWTRVKWHYFKTFVTKPVERELYKQTFGPLVSKRGRELPDYEDIVYNSSIVFGNEHNAITFRPSTPQNFKFIGGFHVEEPVKPLPKDLQDLMDNSPHGVIYFSMGSFWQSKEIPMKLTRELLKVFGELKQTVIWKYEDDLKDLPKNVHTIRWAPQQSILAHPNCKLFITHGGLLSSIESVYFGVPVVAIPVLYDQFTNANRAVANKYAIKVDLNYDLPKNLKAAINRMLSDETFRKNVQELSSIYHDTLTKPGEELTHWVRHVVWTRGAVHLRSPVVDVPLYQLLYLDLAALIIGVLLIINLSIKKLLRKTNKNVDKKKKRQ